MLEQLILDFKNLDEVDALLLGGSRATNVYDEKSDYDFYVYLNKDLSEEKRRNLLDKYCKYMEYSNHFWELEDDGILNNGIEIEFIYRRVNDLKNGLENLRLGNVGIGFTTCFLDNLLDSKIMFDKTEEITELKMYHNDTLTRELSQKIVDKNYPLITDSIPALYRQIKKAVQRNDLHSINHRVTAFFEIYYDILFAINLEPHPGEKRLLQLSSNLKRLPMNHLELVENVFNSIFKDNDEMLKYILKLSGNLRELLIKEAYIK